MDDWKVADGGLIGWYCESRSVGKRMEGLDWAGSSD
jgi:hypothetical protein